MALTTTALVLAWQNTTLDTAGTNKLTACIGSASSWIDTVTGRTLNLTDFVEYYDGTEVNGSQLVLHMGHRPVVYPSPGTHTAFGVKENGTALTVTTGYDSTGTKVIVVNANREAGCYLVRPGGWSTGTQNIEVTYTCGYDSTTAPAALIQLANEVSWLMFSSPTWLGKQSQSNAGASVSWEQNLTPQSKATIDAYKLVW